MVWNVRINKRVAQITNDFVEICSRHQISENKIARIRVAVETILTEPAEGDDTLALSEVFPGLHPGSAIRGLRLREGLTQEQLAEKIGVKRPHISAMERGKRPIGKAMARRLAEALQTDYRVFV
jgi:DNA-binding XRE family transcriptional regulator